MRGYTYDVYGVRLRVEADDGPALRGLVRLLSGFPLVEAAPAGPAGAVPDAVAASDASLSLRFAPRPAAPPPAAQPLFRHAEVRGLRDGPRLWLADGWSCMGVDAAAGRAEGEVHPGSWTREREFLDQFLLLGLLELLRGRGRFHLHAAAMVAGATGILAAGDSGSGKSTMSYAWARMGGILLGDDAVLLRGGPDGVTAGAWPEPLRLDPALAAHFRELSGLSPAGGGARPRLVVARPEGPPSALAAARAEEGLCSGGSAAAAECRPAVLLLPAVTASVTRVEPLAPREALAALIPASALLLADPALAPAHLEALRGLVLQCRCYRLFQGPELLRRPQAVRDLLWALACPQEWTAYPP